MDRKDFVYQAASERETERLGEALATCAAPGLAVGLIGELGSGKTRLVQAVAAALDVPAGEATSPTFVLANHYHGAKEIIHVDAYRLRDEDEFVELGPEEWFESPALVMIEWADRVVDLLPADRLEVEIEATGPETRVFRVVALGDESLRSLDCLIGRLDA